MQTAKYICINSYSSTHKRWALKFQRCTKHEVKWVWGSPTLCSYNSKSRKQEKGNVNSYVNWYFSVYWGCDRKQGRCKHNTWFESLSLRPQKSPVPKPENSVTLLKFRLLKIIGSYYIYSDIKSLDISCFLCRSIFLSFERMISEIITVFKRFLWRCISCVTLLNV